MKRFSLSFLVLTSSAWFANETYGAAIPGLFNTGVNTNRALLAAGAVDPHYRLLESADPNFPGPSAFTLNPGFPVPPWIAEGPDSKWIAPRPPQGIGNAEGAYTYRITFDLTGFDPAKASITGRWSVDNSGLDVALNGVGLGITAGGFTTWTDFTIDTGFVPGTNTLDFIVNNAPPTSNPTGVRVEMRGTIELPAESPSIATQPRGQLAISGDTVTFSVVADGTPPLQYQWQFNGGDLTGATEPMLTLADLVAAQEGAYTVIVSNAVGTVTSAPAVLTVLEGVPGLFNTGVDDQKVVLDDNAIDPHYQLVVNPDSASTEAIVHDSTVFPIVTGPWLPNADTTKWISPRFDTTEAAGGDYVYQTRFDLTGFDPATAVILGSWATDNAGLDLLLNGISTGLRNEAQFSAYTSFVITNGFLSGTNVLEFKLNNAGAGYTGLQVAGLRVGARKRTGPPVQAPTIVQHPRNQIALVGEQVTFTVVADGTAPLSYQWRFIGFPLAGATQAVLVLTNVTLYQAGNYSIVVTNAAGSVTSSNAALTVLEVVPGLFNTGVDDNRMVLPEGTVDPHYRIIESPDPEFSGPDALTLALGFPVPPWVDEGPESRWIAPRPEQATGNAEGNYIYRIAFDLTGFLPTTALLTGRWATDNLGFDILLNGNSTGLRNDAQFTSYTEFTIASGFVSGTNTLDFVVNNAPATPNPTGLRVDNLRGGARRTVPQLRFIGVERSSKTLVLRWTAGRDELDHEIAQLKVINDNLRAIESAKAQWVSEGKGRPGDPPIVADLVPYLGDPALWPIAVGETYNLNPVGAQATATLPATVGLWYIARGGTVSISPPHLLQKKASLSDTNWVNLLATAALQAVVAIDSDTGFYRLVNAGYSDIIPLTVWLSGASERPDPVTTSASGLGTLSLEGNRLNYFVRYGNLSSAATGAHIHGPTNTAGAAPVLIPLAGAAGTSGVLSGAVTLTDAEKGHVLSGLTYVNIHSGMHPGGEIRGQIAPSDLRVRLFGAAERPNPVTTSGFGTGNLTLVGNQLSFDITYTNMSVAATGAHIHGPAPETGTADVLIDLSPFAVSGFGTSGSLRGTVALTLEQFAHVVDGRAYVNIHTSNHPGGEIRGQIKP